MLTISYITNRLEPKFEWFFGSLASQSGQEFPVNVVDFHADVPGRREQVSELAQKYGFKVVHSAPKPNVWSGPHRLTKSDYFSVANASNTAIALCRTPWVAFVDDLSVLMPGWLHYVRQATTRDGITCGSYRKINQMDVQEGRLVSFVDNPLGHDHRPKHHRVSGLGSCQSSWFYGCSFVAPIDKLLLINGFDEDCDGMGYQDVVAGAMLAKHNVKFWFDPRMMTYESDELHHQPGQHFLRVDPGKSPNDKSHKILEMVAGGRIKAPNYFGPGGLREFRERTLRGEPFPIVQIPDREWFTGTLLSEW